VELQCWESQRMGRADHPYVYVVHLEDGEPVAAQEALLPAWLGNWCGTGAGQRNPAIAVLRPTTMPGEAALSLVKDERFQWCPLEVPWKVDTTAIPTQGSHVELLRSLYLR